jgi:cytidylate kinase
VRHYDLVIDAHSIPREAVRSIILQALRARFA